MKEFIYKLFSGYLFWFGAIFIFMGVAFWNRHIYLSLGRPAVFTGWCLFILLIVLAAFNARKRLSMLPLGKASTWLRIHIIGGVFALFLLWLHTDAFWPTGLYEQALALLFYLVTLSGVLGYFLQKFYPPLLSASGLEIIYERIPSEIAYTREQAEAIILACTKETASDTLAQHYLETLEWFFRRPRFCLHHAFGSKKAFAWIHRQGTIVRRYLNNEEQKFLDKLLTLAKRKTHIDLHYVAQSIMKGWLLIHLPLSVAMMALAIWHIIIVHIYSL